MQKESGDQTIKSVLTSVSVLDALAEHGRPMRPVEIARALKMTLPRVSRHLKTLERAGLINNLSGAEGYTLGWKLLQLGKAATNQNELDTLASDALHRLHSQVGETVILSRSADRNAVVLTCIEATSGATIRLRVGQVLRFPLSPSARLIHCFKGEAARELDVQDTPAELIEEYQRHRGSLEKLVQRVRHQLYDYDLNPHGTGFAAIAAPVFDSTDSVVASVGLILPPSRLQDPPDPFLLDSLFECAASISYRLGSTDIWTAAINRAKKSRHEVG